MSRIPTFEAIIDAPEASRTTLEAIRARHGAVPNLYRLTANSPAALEGLIGLAGALEKGALDAPTRERLALAVAEANGCDYCLAAHSTIGRAAGLSPEEIAANRAGRSQDGLADAALAFAVAVVSARGRVPAAAIEAARASGLSDAALVEVVGHVALNTFTNYLNTAFGTALDFPAAAPRQAA